MKSFATEFSGARLRYLEFFGNGPPLVFIHGLGCAASFEYPHVARSGLLSQHHTLLVDLLGFGFSDRPEAFGYRVSDQASVLEDLVRSLGFQKVSLFGHSMGGSVAVETAIRLGSRVEDIILAEGNLDRGGGFLSRPIAAMGREAYEATGHEQLVRESLGEGDDAWATTMRCALPRAVYEAAVSLVEGETIDWRQAFLDHPARKAFIFGERSLPDPDEPALRGAGVRVCTVANAGHAMGIDNPAGLAEAIVTAMALNKQAGVNPGQRRSPVSVKDQPRPRWPAETWLVAAEALAKVMPPSTASSQRAVAGQARRGRESQNAAMKSVGCLK